MQITLVSGFLWSPEMLEKYHFYFKSWLFLVSSESFINKRMSLALTSWAPICRKTWFFFTRWILKKLKSLFLQPPVTDRLRNRLGCVHHAVSVSGSWVTASPSTKKSAMVPGLLPLSCVQCKAQLHCTEGVTSGEWELWCQQFAALGADTCPARYVI